MQATYEFFRENDDRILCLNYENDNCSAHFHSNIEIVYVIKGEITITINGQNRTLTEGGISVANSYDIHAYTTEESSKTIVLIIPIEIVDNFTQMMYTKSFSSPFLESPLITKEIYYAIKKIMEHSAEYEAYMEKGYAYVILGLLIKGIGLAEKTKSSNIDLARKILIYLQQNYTEDVSIGKLSKLLGYNKDYLSRFFNTYLGCSFNIYINQLRIRHAALLLTESNLKTTDIAYQSGFGNYRTFNRVFKEMYNVVPTAYRNTQL